MYRTTLRVYHTAVAVGYLRFTALRYVLPVRCGSVTLPGYPFTCTCSDTVVTVTFGALFVTYLVLFCRRLFDTVPVTPTFPLLCHTRTHCTDTLPLRPHGYNALHCRCTSYTLPTLLYRYTVLICHVTPRWIRITDVPVTHTFCTGPDPAPPPLPYGTFTPVLPCCHIYTGATHYV